VSLLIFKSYSESIQFFCKTNKDSNHDWEIVDRLQTYLSPEHQSYFKLELMYLRTGSFEITALSSMSIGNCNLKCYELNLATYFYTTDKMTLFHVLMDKIQSSEISSSAIERIKAFNIGIHYMNSHLYEDAIRSFAHCTFQESHSLDQECQALIADEIWSKSFR